MFNILTEKDTPSDDLPMDILESLVVDPQDEYVYSTAREYTEIINTTFPTDEEVQVMQEELDSRWGHIDEAVSVSGILYKNGKNKGTIESMTVSDKPLVSKGFIFRPEHISINDEVIARQFSVYHIFIGWEDDEKTVQQQYIAHVDGVFIDFSVESINIARARLDYFYGDLIEEIDEIIYNSESAVESIMGLGGVSFLADMSDSDDIEMITDLQTYIDGSIFTDNQFNYIVKFSGSRGYRYEDQVYKIENPEAAQGGSYN